METITFRIPIEDEINYNLGDEIVLLFNNTRRVGTVVETKGGVPIFDWRGTTTKIPHHEVGEEE